MTKHGNSLDYDFSKLLFFYVDLDIIQMSDVMSLTEETLLMNKILKQVHPYDIFYSASNDRWQTYIKDDTKPSGRKAIVRKKKGDLERYLLSFYHDKLNNLKTYTFDSLYIEFMHYKECTQSKGTVDAYIKAYNRFYANDPIIYEDMRKITVPRLKMWLQQVIDKYKLNYKAYSKFSVVFNQLYKYCMESGYLSQNPFDSISVRNLGLYNTPKKKGRQKVFLRTETADINQIAFDDFARKPYCVPLAVLFTFQTGLRLGEIVALKWNDIDFISKTLKVARFERVEQEYTDDFKTLTKCKHVIMECNTKGDYGERFVDLTDDALYILQLLKDFYETEGIVSEWLFVNKQGRIHNRAMDLRIRRYCRLANMDMEKSMHKIRSTYISMLRDAGMSFEKIAEEVGHKSVITTMKNYSYDTLDDEENKRILNRGLNIKTA